MDRHWSIEDASAILAQQATLWLDDPHSWAYDADGGPTLVRLATRMGVSNRHLRRIFDAHLGLSPLQYLLTRKLLTAKQLLTDTALPVSQVAQASGFSSLRRFNAAFAAHYRLSPSQMRKQPPRLAGEAWSTAGKPVALAWRPPLDASALMAFFKARQIEGIEAVDNGQAPSFRRTLRLSAAGAEHRGWFCVRFEPEAHRACLRVSDGLLGALPNVIWRVRALLDLDADPTEINASLTASFPGGDGLRVPGCVDGFELAVRAILGQQITVAAARTLASRLAERLGEPLSTPFPKIDRLFPTAHAIAASPPDTLGDLGIVRQRQAALQSLARAVLHGELTLDPHANLQSTIGALQELPGIGPWTAQYIAMRALRQPDAWPVGDVALTKALGLQDHRGREAQLEAERRSQIWRPWRSYAVIRAWAGTQSAASATNKPMESSE